MEPTRDSRLLQEKTLMSDATLELDRSNYDLALEKYNQGLVVLLRWTQQKKWSPLCVKLPLFIDVKDSFHRA